MLRERVIEISALDGTEPRRRGIDIRPLDDLVLVYLSDIVTRCRVASASPTSSAAATPQRTEVGDLRGGHWETRDGWRDVRDWVI
jgi:hypothetical protein